MSGYLRDIQLRKQLEEKVKETTRNRQAAEQAYEAARAMIESAEKVDADVSQAREALEEASAAIGAKDFRLAMEKAKRGMELAKQALGSKVRGILDETRALREVLRGVGLDTSETEDLYRKTEDAFSRAQYEEALESSKNIWKISEKTLNEYMSSAFSKAQALLVTAKNLGKDAAPFEDLLARARASVEANEFAQAVSFIRECLDSISSVLRDDVTKHINEAEDMMSAARELGANVEKMSSVLDRARNDLAKGDFEKALNSVKQSKLEGERALQKVMESAVANFSSLIKEAEALGADTSAGSALLRQSEEAMKKGNYGEAATLARKGVAELQAAQFQRVLLVISQSREKFILARDLEADIGGALKHLNRARESLQRGEFREALSFALKADEEVTNLVKEFDNLQSEVEVLEARLRNDERQGIEVRDVEQLIGEAKRALEIKDLNRVRTTLQRGKDILEKTEYDATMELVEQTELVLTAGEKIGAQMQDANRMLEEAVVATRAGDYHKAMELAGESRKNAEKEIEGHISHRIDFLRKSMQFMPDAGQALKIALDKAEIATSARDFDSASAHLEEAQSCVEGQVRSKAENLNAVVDEALRMSASLGLKEGHLRELQGELASLLEQEAYIDIVSRSDDVAKRLSPIFKSLFDAVKNVVIEAGNAKMDIEALKDILKKSKMSFTEGDLRGGLRGLEKCNELATQYIESREEAYGALTGAAALLAEAKKTGIDVSKLVENLKEAKNAFEKQNFDRSLALATKTRAEAEKSMVVYRSAQSIMTAREKLELATKLGLDIDHLKDIHSQAKESMKNKSYEEALALGEKVNKEITLLLSSRLRGLLDEIERVFEGMQHFGLDDMQERISQCKAAMERSELSQAIHLILSVKDRIEQIQAKREEAVSIISRARELYKEGIELNLRLPSTTKMLESAAIAFAEGKFDKAINLANRSSVEMETEKEREVSAILREFADRIAERRERVADTRAAEDLLQKAMDFAREGKFKQALALAGQSEEEIEKVGLQREIASKAIETSEHRLKQFSAPMPDVEAMISEARKAFDVGDYFRALDLAVRSQDQFSMKRELVLSAIEFRQKAEGAVQLAHRLGTDGTSLEKILVEGNVALESGDPSSARLAYQRVLEVTDQRLGKHIETVASEAAKLAQVAKEIEVDASEALRQLSEARSHLNSGEFETSFDLAQEGLAKLERALTERASDSISNAETTVAYAKKMGSEVAESEAVIRRARQALQQGDYRGAIALSREAMEKLEPGKAVEKRFVNLTMKAENTIVKAKKFGIDMREAERLLAEALKLRKTDMTTAIKVAETADRRAWEAVEAFAPNLEATLQLEGPRLKEWTPANLLIRNVGKALAKDVKVRILGDAEVEGLKDLASVKAKGEENIPFKIKMTASGTVPLALQITGHRIFDGKPYGKELVVQVDVTEATSPGKKVLVANSESRCPICKGTIKKGFNISRCSCGREFHEACATRVGLCPVCFRNLQSSGIQ